jgi:HlyD family secretion protein
MTRVLEPGSIIRSGEAVLVVSLADPVWIRAYIPEPDLGKVFPGMDVRIHTDSRPDLPYMGRVGFISPEAEFTPKSVETPNLRTRLVYRLRITVNDPDNGLRQGMPVTIKFPLKKKQGMATSPKPPFLNADVVASRLYPWSRP